MATYTWRVTKKEGGDERIEATELVVSASGDLVFYDSLDTDRWVKCVVPGQGYASVWCVISPADAGVAPVARPREFPVTRQPGGRS